MKVTLSSTVRACLRICIPVASIAVMTAGLYLLTEWYPYSVRRTLAVQQHMSLHSPAEICTRLQALGVKGRTAVVFSRQLIGHMTLEGTQVNVSYLLEDALQQGIVRRVYHVVPDAAWDEVVKEGDRFWPVRHVGNEPIILFGAGRVYLLPLSRLRHIQEKVLVLTNGPDWGVNDMKRIDQLLRGTLSADVLMDLGGRQHE